MHLNGFIEEVAFLKIICCHLVLCDDLEQWGGRSGERLKRKEI